MAIYELCGWFGAILVLIAYYMVSTGKSKPSSNSFQSINIAGAILLVIYTYNCHAYASMLVNIIWIGIGLQAIFKISTLPRLRFSANSLLFRKFKALFIVTKPAAVLMALVFSSSLAAKNESKYLRDPQEKLAQISYSEIKNRQETTSTGEIKAR